MRELNGMKMRVMGASVHPFTHAHEFTAGGVKMIAPTCRATDHKNANVVWLVEIEEDEETSIENSEQRGCDETFLGEH